jgi:hypothetical protein
MARKSHGDVRDKLKYQCDRITELDTPGEDWASTDMPDPLFPNEHGHSVRVVRTKGKKGIIISLTGKKILGSVTDINNEIQVRSELEHTTGAKSWRRKTHKYTGR